MSIRAKYNSVKVMALGMGAVTGFLGTRTIDNFLTVHAQKSALMNAMYRAAPDMSPQTIEGIQKVVDGMVGQPDYVSAICTGIAGIVTLGYVSESSTRL